jgi:hypothetical protein
MPRIEALYVVEFGDVATGGDSYRNGGVAVLETNRIFGGDSGYYYIRRFTITGNQFEANARIVRHNTSLPSAFGDNSLSFNIKVHGQINNGLMQGVMQRLDVPRVLLPMRLTWKEDLP